MCLFIAEYQIGKIFRHAKMIYIYIYIYIYIERERERETWLLNELESSLRLQSSVFLRSPHCIGMTHPNTAMQLFQYQHTGDGVRALLLI